MTITKEGVDLWQDEVMEGIALLLGYLDLTDMLEAYKRDPAKVNEQYKDLLKGMHDSHPRH
jgi:hypothetical protein